MAKMRATRRGAADPRINPLERVPISRERRAAALALFERIRDHMDQRVMDEIDTVDARRGSGCTKDQYEDALEVVGLLDIPVAPGHAIDTGRCWNGLSRDQVMRAIARLRPVRGPNLYRPNWELAK